MTYIVIAMKWDDTMKEQIEYIAGRFPSFHLANMFCKVYNEHYSTNAEVMKIEA